MNDGPSIYFCYSTAFALLAAFYGVNLEKSVRRRVKDSFQRLVERGHKNTVGMSFLQRRRYVARRRESMRMKVGRLIKRKLWCLFGVVVFWATIGTFALEWVVEGLLQL